MLDVSASVNFQRRPRVRAVLANVCAKGEGSCPTRRVAGRGIGWWGAAAIT